MASENIVGRFNNHFDWNTTGGNKSGSTIIGKVKTGAVFTLGGLSVAATSVQESMKTLSLVKSQCRHRRGMELL